MKKSFFTGILIVWLIGDCYSTDKPNVCILFNINEQKYKDRYYPNIPKLEKRLADSISFLLNTRLPLFDFITGKESSDTLLIELTRNASGMNSKTFDIDFVLTLSGKNIVKKCAPIHWDFAPKGSFYEFFGGDDSQFVRNVFNKFKGVYKDEEIITKLFRYRLITERAELIKIDCDKKSWLFSFTYGELKVGFESQFKILQLHMETPPIRRKYFIEVKGEENYDELILTEGLDTKQLESETADDLSTLNKNTKMQIIGLQIMKFNPLSGIPVVVKPTNSGIR